MHRNFHFHYLPLFPHRLLLCNAKSPLPNGFAPNSPLVLSRQFQIRNSIVCAARRNRRSGSPMRNKWILQLVSIAAANSNIFPPPLDLLISVLCGGDGTGGGGSGVPNGFGVGFGGWGRRGSKKLGLGFLVVCGLGLLFSGKGSESALLWKAWGISAIGLLVTHWRRQIKTCILGLCCFGVLVVLGMRKEDRQNWVEKVRNCSPVMEMVTAKQSTGRRRRRSKRRAL